MSHKHCLDASVYFNSALYKNILYLSEYRLSETNLKNEYVADGDESRAKNDFCRDNLYTFCTFCYFVVPIRVISDLRNMWRL